MRISTEFLGTGALRDRGWSRAMIENYMPEPDRLRVNMFYKTGPRLRYSSLERVEALEQTGAFLEAHQAARRRSEVAVAASARRKRRLLENLNKRKIKVPRIAWARLVRLACDSYNLRRNSNDFEEGMESEYLATPDSDPGFLDRIIVNYLRHTCTDYDWLMRSVQGCPGADELREAIRSNAYEAIERRYPDLGDECYRQEDRRFGQLLYESTIGPRRRGVLPAAPATQRAVVTQPAAPS